MKGYFRGLAMELRTRWYLYAMVAVVWFLSVDRTLFQHRPLSPVLFNASKSLPYTLAIVNYSAIEYKRGDFVVYEFGGPALAAFPRMRGLAFFKIVRGVPGDVVTVRGRHIFINGVEVGVALEHGPKHFPLHPIAPVTIPAGYYYMQGTDPSSFDSRYEESGLVNSSQFVASVTPIF